MSQLCRPLLLKSALVKNTANTSMNTITNKLRLQSSSSTAIMLGNKGIYFFSSSSDDNNNKNKNDKKAKNSKDRKKDESNKKENFAKKFLEPAARGELTKGHQSGIPKLAARKAKGHGIKDAGDGDDDFQEESRRNENLQSVFQKFSRERKGGGSMKNQQKQQQQQQKSQQSSNNYEQIFAEPTYEDLNPQLATEGYMKWLGPKKGSSVSRTFQSNRNLKERPGNNNNRPRFDAEFQEMLNEYEEDWETDTLEMTYKFRHDDELRTGKKITYPTNRVDPPKEFIEAHGVFMYVSNLPHDVIENDDGKEELSNYENPMHKSRVADYVCKVFKGVPLENVFVSTMTSAFVGFKDAKEASKACLDANKGKRMIKNKVDVNLYNAEKEGTDANDDKIQEFISSSNSDGGSIVTLKNLPAGMKPHEIVQSLHPTLQSHNLTIGVKDVYFSSVTTALVHVPTSADATTTLLQKTNNLRSALAPVETQTIHIQAAHREEIQSGFTGPVNFYREYKLSDKSLVVDGDMASKKFYIAHGKVLQLTNIPSNMTRLEISNYFQKYCMDQRDVEGSIEFVHTLDGDKTGRVYVGFDLEEEGKRAWDDIFSRGQSIVFEGREHETKVRARPVKDRKLLKRAHEKRIKLAPRSYRSEEELLASLNVWEEYADPKDMELLESMGVTKDVLADTFMALRKNPTFGIEDQERAGERLREDKEPGQHYREFVKEYLEIMKEVAATRENPGLLYKAMFLPDEQMEYSLFDDEEKRLAKLKHDQYYSES